MAESVAQAALPPQSASALPLAGCGNLKHMSDPKIAVTLNASALREVDELVRTGKYSSRSRLLEEAVLEKLDRLHHDQLVRECAKLQPAEERAAAEEFLVGEAAWPEY
jgi:Arc/MetJ-type ribon-helix-helix transcriptional regulator